MSGCPRPVVDHLTKVGWTNRAEATLDAYRLVVFVVMGLATPAYGVAVELQFGPGTTGVVDPTGDSVTLMGSDIAQIDVWAVDLSNGLSFWGIGVDVAPPLTEPPDFTYEGAVPGPLIYPYGFVAPTLDGNSFASG